MNGIIFSYRCSVKHSYRHTLKLKMLSVAYRALRNLYRWLISAICPFCVTDNADRHGCLGGSISWYNGILVGRLADGEAVSILLSLQDGYGEYG